MNFLLHHHCTASDVVVDDDDWEDDEDDDDERTTAETNLFERFELNTKAVTQIHLFNCSLTISPAVFGTDSSAGFQK